MILSLCSYIAAVRPTVPELCLELVELVNWENAVIHLPEMSFAEVQNVKRNEPRVDQQKQEAFDTWLRRCPEASWSHVRDALHKAREYTLEKKIATNHGLSLLVSEEPSRKVQDNRTAVQTGCMVILPCIMLTLCFGLILYLVRLSKY